MSEDIQQRLCVTNQNQDIHFTSSMYNDALVSIEDTCLAIANKTLVQLEMICPNRCANDMFDRDLKREIQFAVNSLGKLVQINLPKLNPEQRCARRHRKNFSDFPYIANDAIKKNIALAIASSGIALTLLDGGRTAHSALKLPLNLQIAETPTCNINKNSGVAKVLQSCEIIIWNEFTMAHKKALKALHHTLKDLRGNERLFGSALTLLSGDSRQTLPVIPRLTAADELNACLKSSDLWRYFHKLSLQTNMRVEIQNDASSERFAKQLLDIRNGKM
ncbi:ATP-dependent DNA helicase pif1 [Thelohanellus kitauei]|uniref:ATP-dependent DNA helicase n=1 Tax=Thelohanellus kitauei TaxID=669202 RepID=A0A0C2MP37_THEKT|nr:ATP-dependent DNA helicase pif1 [Thelohanellus kitauei]